MQQKSSGFENVLSLFF